ncbi:MAG TPA: NAD-dependent epimerase/dehydratase family protein [Glycomyces sp.]|nr:NAD-dependent epimerase/dehydratase family protein [Glycomyces sp.]
MTRTLIEGGHEVLGLARNAAAVRVVEGLGATPVAADAMDRDALLRAVDGHRADAVIHRMTAPSKPRRALDDSAPSTALRKRGTTYLLAAEVDLGETVAWQTSAAGKCSRPTGRWRARPRFKALFDELEQWKPGPGAKPYSLFVAIHPDAGRD